MDQMIRDTLLNWKDIHHSEASEVPLHLAAITKYVCELMWKQDFKNMKEMCNMLGFAVASERVDRQSSLQQAYNLGMAHNLTDMINYFLEPYMLQQLSKEIKEQEAAKVLQYVYVKREVSYSEVAADLKLSNEVANGLLKTLRLMGLINVWSIGLMQRFSLTTLGKSVIKYLVEPVAEGKSNNYQVQFTTKNYGSGENHIDTDSTKVRIGIEKYYQDSSSF